MVGESDVKKFLRFFVRQERIVSMKISLFATLIQPISSFIYASLLEFSMFVERSRPSAAVIITNLIA